jgi:primosomal protein N' (replication factor Y)
MFARLAVNLSAVSGVFDYAIPPELAGTLAVGSLVTAPFGKQTVQGVVLELVERASVAETKPLASVLDPVPVLTVAQIHLAQWMSEHYLQPLAAMVDLMLPAGLSQQADTIFDTRYSNDELSDFALSLVASRIVKLINEKGPLRGRQIDRHFAQVDWRKVAQMLVRKGILHTRSVLPPPRVRPKFVRVAQLAVPPEEAEAAMSGLGSTPATVERRQKALRFLIHAVDAVNLSWVYAESGCKLADLEELEERGLIRLFESEVFRDSLEKIESRGIESSSVILTAEQSVALKEIITALTPRRDRLRQDGNLFARRGRDHQARAAGHHPRP